MAIDKTTGLELAAPSVTCSKNGDSLHLVSNIPLGPVVKNTGEWLHHWAAKTPDAVFLAERDGDGWREVTYAQTLKMVRAIGTALLDRGMTGDRPIAIISGNGVDHALLSYAAQYVGVPTVPLAEQYSLIPEAHARLLYVINRVKPAMIYADNALRYAAALSLPDMRDLDIIVSDVSNASVPVTAFTDLLNTVPTPAVDAAFANVGPQTLAKILFTSGSSADPKGVLTTQQMMCANQSQLGSVLPFLDARAPRILDWLPWNHVFGGSHNVNMMLAHGGAVYIDNGKPVKALFQNTIDNIRTRPGTVAFNVPAGFAMLAAAMKNDPDLRRSYFQDLDMLFYAGASLPQDVWTALETYALEVKGRLPLMTSSWGLTETAPATLMVHEHIGRSGVIGVPLPGTEIKLIPDAEMRCEVRVKGINIMPGYHNDEAKTRDAFDDEGFFVTGDAVRFVDASDPNRGLVFDGRVSEDFKLSSGTWVQAGKLRLNTLEHLAGMVQDVVICGHDRAALGLFVFPHHDRTDMTKIDNGAVVDPALLADLRQSLGAFAAAATGSAARITRLIVLAEPPSLKDNEITDKGSLNVRKIITRRADLLDRLYDDTDPAVIKL